MPRSFVAYTGQAVSGAVDLKGTEGPIRPYLEGHFCGKKGARPLVGLSFNRDNR